MLKKIADFWFNLWMKDVIERDRKIRQGIIDKARKSL